MKMANLDTLRGYATKTSGEVQQTATTESIDQSHALGYQVLNEPMWNKGESIASPLSSSLPVSPAVVLLDLALFRGPQGLLCMEHTIKLKDVASPQSVRICVLRPPPLPTLQQFILLSSMTLMPHSMRSMAANCSRSQGLSFTPEQRIAKNLTGLIPHVMEDTSRQCERALKMIRTRQTNIDKYLYLSTLKSQNVDLFYRLLIDNASEMMPLVYTPTIGDVCLQYSTLYTRPEALYISIKQRKSIRTMLRNWPYKTPEICVVTDGSRILGLGDLGVNGVGIPVSGLGSHRQSAEDAAGGSRQDGRLICMH